MHDTFVLYTKQPNGRYRAVTDDELFAEAAAKRLKLFSQSRLPLTSPRDVAEFLKSQLAHKDHEVFAVLFLDARHRLLRYEEMFRGTIDGATVYPREVVKRALHWNASAVILAHPHPSGVAEPSEADRSITQKLSRALMLIEVRLLDHIVVGGEHVTSMAERGLL